MASTTIPLHRKLVFAGLATLLAFGAIEGALRVALGPPPPPVRVFGALGERDHWFEEQDGTAKPTYLPSPDWEVPRYAISWEGPRVAVLGASSVRLGSGLHISQEFPALLEQRLGVPVLNLGSPGLDSFDLAAIAEEIADWDLSVLVVYEGHNDLGNTYFQQRYGDASASRRIRLRAALEHLQIFARLNRLFAPTEGTAREQLDPSEQIFPSLTADQRATARAYFMANLRRITWLAHRRGMGVVLVTPASRLDDPPLHNGCVDGRCAQDAFLEARQLVNHDPIAATRLLEEARDRDGLSMRATSAMTSAVREVAANERVWLVDAAADLPRDAHLPIAASWLFSDILHFSESGHQAMAALIEPAVRDALSQTSTR